MDGRAEPPQRVRRKKTAEERRAQALRAEARTVSRLLKGLESVHSHRGGVLSKIGLLMMRTLQEARRPPAAAEPPRPQPKPQPQPRPPQPAVDRRRVQGSFGLLRQAVARDAAAGGSTQSAATAAATAAAVHAMNSVLHAAGATAAVSACGQLAGAQASAYEDDAGDDVTVNDEGGTDLYDLYDADDGRMIGEQEQEGYGSGGNVETCLSFRARLRARVRVAPSAGASSVEMLDVGERVTGILRGRWIEVLSGRLRGTFIQERYDDDEQIMMVEVFTS